jgi:hypothetical protein
MQRRAPTISAQELYTQLGTAVSPTVLDARALHLVPFFPARNTQLAGEDGNRRANSEALTRLCN